MKATITDLVLTEREVDIPSTCPNPECGALFRSDEALLLIHMVRSDVEAGVVTSEDHEPLEYDLIDYEDQGQIRLRMAYVCGKCGHVLAEAQVLEARPAY